MQKAKRIVIVAGEESGDLHASVLIQQLKIRHPSIEISGLGGQHMKKAGAELIEDLARHGVTGLTEVFRSLKILYKAFTAIKKHLETQKPDLLILVDYPGFNLRLAKYAKKKLNLRILYYISPQIWAWKAKRIHVIKEYVESMAVIFPFEKALYEKAGIPVHFVGHPLMEKIPPAHNKQASREVLQLPTQKTILALLPGSRSNEIKKHMPILQKTVQLLRANIPNLHFVIPIASTVLPQQILNYLPNSQAFVSLVPGKAIDCMAAADFVIVASGTASLECALLEKPMCIIYKSSFLTYMAAAFFIKVKFLGLCNLLLNKMIVPEFLQYDCNAQELSQYIIRFYQDEKYEQKKISQLAELREMLSIAKADCSLLELVEKTIAL